MVVLSVRANLLTLTLAGGWILLLLVQDVSSAPSHSLRHRHRHGPPSGCSRCPPGFGVLTRCVGHRNTKCVPCPAGSSYSRHHSYRMACSPCSRCGEGLYVSRPCTSKKDTVCDACTNIRGRKTHDYWVKCNSTIQLTRAKDPGHFAAGSMLDWI